MSTDENHPYVPAGSDDSRSPCPALNALANHGYLPHDGRNLTQAQLVSALSKVYNISSGFGSVLALGGLLLCGHKKPGLTLARTVDLHDLARHNAIEHDGSLVHDDAPEPKSEFAPTAVDPALLQQLLDSAADDAGWLRLGDLCHAQVRRQTPGASRPLDALHTTFAKGELALLFEAMGVSVEEAKRLPAQGGDGAAKVVPKRFLEQWLGEERLPDGWVRPVAAIGHTILHARVQEIGKLEDAIRAEAGEVAGVEGATRSTSV
ncbi:Chloroperoxidase [Fomes fomentarius]|nr:Chloroperoxidase [Fomes fomentarius]